ncbi:MAG: NmrA family NAD(P)-binding protein [Thermodesulfobacteriota bacterium]
MILITGITGTTGIEVANLISKTKVKVRALVRDSQSAALLEKMGIKIAEGNLESRDTIRRAINGVQKIFLLTANNPKQVEQEKNLIDVSYEANVKHIVKFSIIGADSNSRCGILKRHSTSEIYLENSKINYTHIRPNLFMQNFLMFANTIKKSGEFYYPLKTARCGFVDVRDVANVIVKILLDENHEQYNKRIYTLTGPDLLSCKDVAEIFSTYIHKRVSYINISAEKFIKVLQKFKFKKVIAVDYSNLYSLASEGLFDKKTSDIFYLTNTKPRSFENFVKENIEYFN